MSVQKRWVTKGMTWEGAFLSLFLCHALPLCCFCLTPADHRQPLKLLAKINLSSIKLGVSSIFPQERKSDYRKLVSRSEAIAITVPDHMIQKPLELVCGRS